MLLSALAILVGLGLLVWSADLFVEGASATAKNLGVSSLIIGITIIGFGTSAPEILISIFSVFDNTPDLAIGNALGSNIANIGLILGITALIMPLGIASKILKREFPILIIASIILSWTVWDMRLDLIDGIVLLSSLFIALIYLMRYSQSSKDDVLSSEMEQEIPHDIPTRRALLLTLTGLLILVGSSKLLVWGAVNIAIELGVSELVIGLTIVALGTSLPELAASIAGVKKNESDLVIGNVVGSNLFNSLAVIGIPAIMTDFDISPVAIHRDLSVTLGFTALLFLLAYLPKSSCCKLTRFKGGILLLGFVLYQSLLYYQVVNQS
jgi:cation:H+ antiporter